MKKAVLYVVVAASVASVFWLSYFAYMKLTQVSRYAEDQISIYQVTPTNKRKFPLNYHQNKYFLNRLAKSAAKQLGQTTSYDGAYVRLEYPGGDVPTQTGVCTDVVIRAYREMGVDLQQLIHEDMVKSFGDYPKLFSLNAPDSNIDHRRVPNQVRFFQKFGDTLPISRNFNDFHPGDIIAWDVYGRTHVGIVYEHESKLQIIHNIGGGTQIDNKLFSWKMFGHYRYLPSGYASRSVIDIK